MSMHDHAEAVVAGRMAAERAELKRMSEDMRQMNERLNNLASTLARALALLEGRAEAGLEVDAEPGRLHEPTLPEENRINLRGKPYLRLTLPSGKWFFIPDMPLLPKDQWEHKPSGFDDDPGIWLKIYDVADENKQVMAFDASSFPNELVSMEDLKRLGIDWGDDMPEDMVGPWDKFLDHMELLESGRGCHYPNKPLLPKEDWEFMGKAEADEGEKASLGFRIYNDNRRDRDLIGYYLSDLPNELVTADDLERLGIDLNNV